MLHLDGGVLSERREQLCVESPLQILVTALVFMLVFVLTLVTVAINIGK